MRSILEVKNVNQVFHSGFWMKKKQVLHSIDFCVPEKSVFGFLGANGAGKTTLIHLIVGIKRPFSGELKVNGFLAHTPEARRHIGYLPERPYFYEHLTGENLLRFFGKLSGLSHDWLEARIPKVLESVGMQEARKVELKKYSKGMLQRIGIAQAILHDPSFLVLDEPMSGLDPIGRKEIRELILNLAALGKTVFFSSHVIPDVESICDQIALIQEGRLVEVGPIVGFLDKEKTQIEFGLAGVKEKQIKEFFSFVREIPEGVRAVLEDSSKTNEIIRSLVAQNIKILWITPLRPSLESRFEHAYLRKSL